MGNEYSGTFITIEGIDGSGKSTVLDRLNEHYDYVHTMREPSDSGVRESIIQSLQSDQRSPLLTFFMFMTDRVKNIEFMIEPVLESGGVIISDRYADSTRAYQTVDLSGEGAPFDTQEDARNFIEMSMEPWLIEPDVTFYIDVDVDTALDRCEKDVAYENRRFLTDVKRNYDALAESEERIVRLDGNRSVKNITSAIHGRLDIPEPDHL